MSSVRSRRQPTISRTPVSLAASMGAHDAGETVAVDDADRLDTEHGRLRQTVPRRTKRRAGRKSATSPAARHSVASSSSEHPMQEPVVSAGLAVLAITGTKDPIAFAGIILDLEIIAHGCQFGIALPPLAEDALRPVGTPDPAPDAAPGEATGMISSSAMVSISSGCASSRVGRGQ